MKSIPYLLALDDFLKFTFTLLYDNKYESRLVYILRDVDYLPSHYSNKGLGQAYSLSGYPDLPKLSSLSINLNTPLELTWYRLESYITKLIHQAQADSSGFSYMANKVERKVVKPYPSKREQAVLQACYYLRRGWSIKEVKGRSIVVTNSVGIAYHLTADTHCNCLDFTRNPNQECIHLIMKRAYLESFLSGRVLF